MSIPNVPIPTPLRGWILRKAIWDYLRKSLSYDQANAVKARAEAVVAASLDDIIAGAK